MTICKVSLPPTAKMLGVINSSPSVVAPVFEAVLEKVTRLCEASFGIMNTLDGERFRAGAARRVRAALVEWSERNSLQFGLWVPVLAGKDCRMSNVMAALASPKR